MAEPREVLPTAADLSVELLALGVDEEIIATATLRATQARQETEKSNRWNNDVTTLMASYRRISSEDSNDNNIEGWYEQLDDYSFIVLKRAAELPEKTDLQQQTIQTAAVLHFYLTAEKRGKIKTEVLDASGVDGDWLYEYIKNGFIGVYNPQSSAEVQARIDADSPDLAVLAKYWRYDPRLWLAIVTPIAEKLYNDLKESGLELPELGADGLYDEEREED